MRSIAYHQHKVLYIIIAKEYTACCWWDTRHCGRDDIQSKRTDDMPLLSQWIKKFSLRKARIFWQGQKDLILARTTRSVFHGRGRPPEVRSVPFPLQVTTSVLSKKTEPQGLCLFAWCGWQDLNLHSDELDPKSSASANSATPAC